MRINETDLDMWEKYMDTESQTTTLLAGTDRSAVSYSVYILASIYLLVYTNSVASASSASCILQADDPIANGTVQPTCDGP